MKKIIPIMTALLLGSAVHAQQGDFQRLQTGDKLPDVEFSYTQNGQTQRMNTKDLRGKLVILDFWNIWCGTCIALMPHMEQLQKQFSGDLQIFLVTNNSQKQINGQFEAIEKRNHDAEPVRKIPEGLASVVADTILHKLFPHRAVPHHIWIDRDGRVKYITSGINADFDNVSAALKGDKINMPLKKDTGSFDFDAPLYLEGAGRQLKNLRCYAMLYKEAGEFQNTRKIERADTAQGIYHFRRLNSGILNLYREATRNRYGQKFYAENRLIVETSDSSKLYWPKDNLSRSVWRTENLYCYDLAIPLANQNLRDSIMLADLNRFLPYNGRIEQREVDCLALVLYKTKKPSIESDSSVRVMDLKNDGSFVLQNGTMKDLISNGFYSIDHRLKTPVVDQTGYHGKVSVTLSKMTDLGQVRKDLRAYGFDLVEKKLSTEILVIRDNK